ncbi:LysR substrate-binding domain-containing protein [Methylocapsa polymorpha]|uniref:LysR substrate-binding domain-containing protein n=1 Tax=Methylocapsa polymorpha TaxID=3080828 RepID=A0ABZ0HXK2_9HYPH|nr:LysR substrate-binding domain-containing protein [Methylocapsa sp. RX1]
MDAIATFVAVVRTGHFAAAARSLGLPNSTASQRVARLEESLGVRLLERTTRVLRPTGAGAAYYERCVRILTEVEEANAAVRDLGTSPRGTLRVATTHLLGQALVAAVAAVFCQRHPAIEVEVIAMDRRVSLLEEGLDVAIVVGASEPDSTMISRVVSRGQTWCCATPSYLAIRGAPCLPQQLSGHDCIIRQSGARDYSHGAIWTFERDDEVQRVEIHGRLSLSSIMMTHAAVLAGAGVAAIPSFLCAEEIQKGRLVRLLPDWIVERKDIRIVHPSNRHLSARVRLFIDAVVATARDDKRFSTV